MGKHPDARNRDFLRFEQTHKVQDYRLAEARGEEFFDDDFQVRACSMAAPKAQFAGVSSEGNPPHPRARHRASTPATETTPCIARVSRQR